MRHQFQPRKAEKWAYLVKALVHIEIRSDYTSSRRKRHGKNEKGWEWGFVGGGGRWGKTAAMLCCASSLMKPVGVQKTHTLRFSLGAYPPRCSSHLPSPYPQGMSRGGGRGGRGGGRGGRGGFGGSNAPPMGLTFADLQNLSREATALYPVCSTFSLSLICNN